MILHLSLIFIPIVAFIYVHSYKPKYTWRITGLTFGAIVYPFFAALSISLIYLGSIGSAIVGITNPVAIFHRAPGKAAYSIIFGHPSIDNLWLIGLSGIIWCVIYGAMGWYADRSQISSKTRVLFLLIAIPVLYKIITFGALSVEIINEAKDNKDFGKICHQLTDAKPNTDVWIRISSSKSGVIRLRSLESSQSCTGFRVSHGPFQLAVGDPPQITIDVPLSSGNKTCVGLTPSNKNGSPYGTEWSAKVIDCSH